VQDWAERYVLSTDLSYKLCPPPVPDRWEVGSAPRRITGPGRPAELRAARRRRSPASDLSSPAARARLLHAFLHHERQAAELMCWAILAFADREPAFLQGLLGICRDEIRHANGYREQIERLGLAVGAFPVRDWFWQRIPSCRDALGFVALMGMGLEAANLDHCSDYEARLLAAGDAEAATFQAQVGREERGHVAFAVHWFERWTGGQDFDRWRALLPPPLSPLLMRGRVVNREARRSAGMSAELIASLERYEA
jgi:uncharacterized ferritin-like protein (DUF455 family)